MVETTHHVQGTPSPPPACELGCPASRSVASQGLPGRPVATRRVCDVERFTAHLWSLPSAGAPPQQLLSSLPTSPHPQQGCQGGQFRQASCFCSCSRGNTNRAEPALIVVFLLLLKLLCVSIDVTAMLAHLKAMAFAAYSAAWQLSVLAR